jgi:hypothetical protein
LNFFSSSAARPGVAARCASTRFLIASTASGVDGPEVDRRVLRGPEAHLHGLGHGRQLDLCHLREPRADRFDPILAAERPHDPRVHRGYRRCVPRRHRLDEGYHRVAAEHAHDLAHAATTGA